MNVLIADTAGQEQLKALSNQYYQKADGILLVNKNIKKEGG